MHQIYITAILTTILSLFGWGWLVFYKTKKEEIKLFFILFCLQLPISFLVLYFIRTPWTDFLVQELGKSSPYILVEKLFEAPILEELAKLWPLLIPFFWRKITKENALKVGLALGFGFGIGEIWTIAHMTAANSGFANYNWYEFTGFISERFIVSFLHGAITGLGLMLIRNKSKLWILFPMFLHFLLNGPIFLKLIDFGGLIAKNEKAGEMFWTVALSIWVSIFFIAILTIFLLKSFSKGKSRLKDFIYGKGDKCSHCKKTYENPSWALNFLFFKYKKCPNCGRWSKSYK